MITLLGLRQMKLKDIQGDTNHAMQRQAEGCHIELVLVHTSTSHSSFHMHSAMLALHMCLDAALAPAYI